MDPEAISGSTLTEVLDGLRDEGYAASFVVDDDGLVTCRSCGATVLPAELAVDGLRRLEGASDPADMAAVLAVHCEACHCRGSIVVRYGPEAGPGDASLLLAVDFERGRPLDVAETAAPPPPPSGG